MVDLDQLPTITPEQWAAQPGALFGAGSVAGKLRILAFTPTHPAYGIKPQTWQCIQDALTAYDGPLEWALSNGDNPHTEPFENVAYQHNKARDMALAGGYDALLSIEADMVVPPDTIARLIACESDVAYGLYVWRHNKTKNRWSAYTELTLWGGTSVALDPTGETARRAWGNVIDVAGVGMGCTLIRRNVLEQVQFRLYEGKPNDWLIPAYAEGMKLFNIDPDRPRTGMLCDDWFFALDAQHYGFSQRCDLGLVCGHVNGDTVLWPDPNEKKLFREETL